MAQNEVPTRIFICQKVEEKLCDKTLALSFAILISRFSVRSSCFHHTNLLWQNRNSTTVYPYSYYRHTKHYRGYWKEKAKSTQKLIPFTDFQVSGLCWADTSKHDSSRSTELLHQFDSKERWSGAQCRGLECGPQCCRPVPRCSNAYDGLSGSAICP